MCNSTTLDELYLARGVPEYSRTQAEQSYIESFDLFYQNRDRIVRALERKMTAISKSYSLIHVESYKNMYYIEYIYSISLPQDRTPIT